MDTSQLENRYIYGKVYILTSEFTDQVYIGSSCLTLPEILKRHKNHHCAWINKHPTAEYCTSFILFDLGIVRIDKLQDYACNSLTELTICEQYWLDNHPAKKVNKRRAYISPEQIQANNIKRCNEWYYNNHEKELEKRKQTIACECGFECRKSNMSRHKKSQKHFLAMEKLQNN